MSANAMGIGLVVAVIAIAIAVMLVLESYRKGKLRRRFRAMGAVLDSGTVNQFDGPEIRGAFHGREVRGLRRTEMIGITPRGGYNGKTLFDVSCWTPFEFTSFTYPLWPMMAELLRVASPKVLTGDRELDRACGFATPDVGSLVPWAAKPENKKALLALMAHFPPCKRQRFRVRVMNGKVELNMPEYLFFKMSPEKVKALFEELDRFCARLEGARKSTHA
jgi:hypothetical protein